MCDNERCDCHIQDKNETISETISESVSVRDCRDGRDGARGPRGRRGEKGDKGDRGERGEKGECIEILCRTRDSNHTRKDKRKCSNSEVESVCKKYILDFCDCTHNSQDSRKIYNISNIFNIIIYGFTNKICHPIFIKSDSSKAHKNGLCCVPRDSCEPFLQIDLGDFIRIRNLGCDDPRLKIGNIQKYEKIILSGSNLLGELGTDLYSYTDNNDCQGFHEIVIPSFDTQNRTKTGDLYMYGTLPFRYISIRACNSPVVLNSLTFYFF